MFKEQIATFRDAIPKLFGFQIDMASEAAAGATRFTLRSAYVLEQGATLDFRCTGKEAPMELLPNAHTKEPSIAPMVSTFVQRCRSIPAFTANYTMEEFNKRTLA